MRSKQGIFLLSLLLVFILGTGAAVMAAQANTASPATSATQFKDVTATDSNALFINYVAKRGFITGFPDGSFQPDGSLTRAQAASILVRTAGLNTKGAKIGTFKDVPANHWAAESIAAAAQAGYLKGFPDKSFRPEDKLTRAQGISMLFQLSKQAGNNQAVLPILNDMDKNHWAAQPVAAALSAGMIGFNAEQKNFFPDVEFKRGDLARALSIFVTREPELSKNNLFATLKVKSGDVKVVRVGGKEEIISGTSTLNTGDSISTGSGEAELSFPDGSGLLLKSNTQLVVKESRGKSYLKADGSPGNAIDYLEVELKQGKLFGALASKYSLDSPAAEQKPTGGLSRKNLASLGSMSGLWAAAETATKDMPWYETSQTKKVKVKVDMPWGVAAIRGSFWGNTVTSSGNSTSLLEGQAEVISGGQTQVLSQLQSTTVTAQGAPPAAPTQMNAGEQREWTDIRVWVETRAQEIVSNQEASVAPPTVTNTPVAAAPPVSTTPNIPSVLSNALNQVSNGGAPNSSSPGSSGGGNNNSNNSPGTPSTSLPNGAWSLQNIASVTSDQQTYLLTQEFAVTPPTGLDAAAYEIWAKNSSNYYVKISSRLPLNQKFRHLAVLFAKPENIMVKFYNSSEESTGVYGLASGGVLSNLVNKTISGTINLPAGTTAPQGGIKISVNTYTNQGGGIKFSQTVTIETGTSSAAYSLPVTASAAGNGYYVTCKPSENNSQAYFFHGSSSIDVSTESKSGVDFNAEAGKWVTGSITLPSPAAKDVWVDLGVKAYGMNFSNFTVQVPSGQSQVSYKVAVPAGSYKAYYQIYDTQFCSNNNYLPRGYYQSAGTTVANESEATQINLNTDLTNINFNVLPGNYRYIKGTVYLPDGATNTTGQNIKVYINACQTGNSNQVITGTSAVIAPGSNHTDYSILINNTSMDYCLRYSITNGYLCSQQLYLSQGYFNSSANGKTVLKHADAETINVYSATKEGADLTILNGGKVISGTVSMPAGMSIPASGFGQIIIATNVTQGIFYHTWVELTNTAPTPTYYLVVPDNYTYQIYNCGENGSVNHTSENVLATVNVSGSNVNQDVTLKTVTAGGSAGGGVLGASISPDDLPVNSVLINSYAFKIADSGYSPENVAGAMSASSKIFYKSPLSSTSGKWFNLLDADATSQAYFENTANSVSSGSLPAIYSATGIITFSITGSVLSCGNDELVMPAYFNGQARSCTISPGDASVNVSQTDTSVADLKYTASATPGYGTLQVEAKKPGTSRATITISKTNYSTISKEIDIRVVPRLQILPPNLSFPYTSGSTLSVQDLVYGQVSNLWTSGQTIGLMPFDAISGGALAGINIPSVTAEEDKLNFTAPNDLPAGSYGVLVSDSSSGTPVALGMTIFNVAANPAGITGVGYDASNNFLRIRCSNISSGSAFDPSKLIYGITGIASGITVNKSFAGAPYNQEFSPLTSGSPDGSYYYYADPGVPGTGILTIKMYASAASQIESYQSGYLHSLQALNGWNTTTDGKASSFFMGFPITFINPT